MCIILWSCHLGGKSHLIKFISLSLSGYLSLIWGKSLRRAWDMEFMRTGCSDRCRHIWANDWNKATTAVACKEAPKWSRGYDDSICWPKLFIHFKRLHSWNCILGAGYLKIADFIFTQQWSRFNLHLSNKQDFAEKGCFTACQLPFPPGDSQHWHSCRGIEMLSISSGRQAIILSGCTWSVDVFVHVWVSSSPHKYRYQ